MAALWVIQTIVVALFASPVGALDNATRVSISRSPSPEVPARGPMLVNCFTTKEGAQMRVLVQRPTDVYPVPKTFDRLISSGDYSVNIIDRLSVSVTIKEVTNHNMTSYACVQYGDSDDDSAVSDTFLLVVPKPMSVDSSMKKTEHGMKVTVNWKIENQMDIDSFSVLLSCGNGTHTWENSRNNLDGTTRETCFRLTRAYVKNCNATVKAISDGVTVGMATTSVQGEEEVVSCGFFGIVQLIITSIILVLTVVLISVVICVCCKRQKRRKIASNKLRCSEEGNGYLRLNNTYQVEIKKVSPPPPYEQSEKGVKA